MHSYLFIKGYAYSKSFWGYTIQTRTFIYRFMEVDPYGSNILWKECPVCFERMEKAYVKTSVFHDIHI